MRKTNLIRLIISWMMVACSYSSPFDQKVWLANPEMSDTHNPRARMVEDLMRNHLKPGMSRASILSLLGKPYKDGVEHRLPKGVDFPDSLSSAFIHSGSFTPEQQKKALDDLNAFHRLHSQPDTLMLYPVGWSTIDPNFLAVKFDGNGKVREYWVEQH